MGGLAGLLGALLYYFGWARASATYAYFGLGIEMLDLSFQDYLLRSVQAAFWPLIAVGLIGLATLPVHGLIANSQKVPAIALTLASLGVVGILVGAAAVARWIAFPTTWPVVPAVLLVSTLLMIYASRLLGHGGNKPSGAIATAQRVMIVAIIVLLAFWAVSTYASHRGVSNAAAIAANLSDRSGVVVYSEKHLHLRGSGIAVQTITDPDSAYRFCFAGLRLLIHTEDRHVLFPEHWQHGRDPIIVLTGSEGIRFEYVRSTEPTTCP